ncbi:MAG: hypothetical protein RL220_310 [Bacteroidota bacterium]
MKYRALNIFIVIIATMIIWSGDVNAQDPLPAQYFNVRHYSNPAYTALFGKDFRISALNRRQWGWLPGGYTTNMVSGETGFFRDRSGLNSMGVGLVILQDKAGKPAYQSFMAQCNIATHLRIDAGVYLSMGIAGKYIQRSMDFTALRWDSQYNGVNHDPGIDSGENPGDMSRSIFDLSWGAAVSGGTGQNETTVGYAFHHLRQNESVMANGTSKLPMLHELSAFNRTKLRKTELMSDLKINRQAGAMMISAMARLGYRFGSDSRYTDFRTSTLIYAGIGYRWADAILFAAGCEYERRFNIGIAYELTTSVVSDQAGSNGAMEIVLSWSGLRTSTRRTLSKT